jgi:2-polyprenyl-3-methyl-5-hydroxy-6-metoxy-1,4-benzoquinol methylase
MSFQFKLPDAGCLHPNDTRDPLRYYYLPIIGCVYRHRLKMALSLVPKGGKSVLEVGIGSGILVPTLTAGFSRYHGIDLKLAAGLDNLVQPGCLASFHEGDVLDRESLPNERFDVVLCLSVLEHISELEGAVHNLTKMLAPGGTLVAGYPMVNQAMSYAFRLIGYPNIEADHISRPRRIESALSRFLQPINRIAFPPGTSVDFSLYRCTAWQRNK